MKKTIYLFMMLFSLAFLLNCSKDDEDNNTSSSSSGQIVQKLVGKWYFSDPSTKPSTNNSFTFTSNGKVTYSYHVGNGTDYDSETGTFSVSGDKLTMVFPEKVTLTFIQKVVFVTDKKVQFVATGNPKEEPYDGTYYKAN